ncbi:MAG: DNA-deoxyinosine glycosylase [Bacillota bacterium]|jgi:TDG/mug DNA glycosylase family protein
MTNNLKKQIHNIEPLFNKDSKILILGSFPSVKSREGNFFYHHPQNRFWKVMAGILEMPVPQTIEEKSNLLLNNRIALWDVIASCEIIGSADSSIQNVIPNDLNRIFQTANIRKIYLNGGKAHALYQKYLAKNIGLPVIKLPSTSPANAGYSLDRLLTVWRQIAEDLKSI